jgi:hypothetical protein
VPSAEQLRRDITRLTKDEAALRRKLSDAQGDAAKARTNAHEKRSRALRTSSTSTADRYLRDAERLERKAADHDKKAADVSRKLADNNSKQAAKNKALEGVTRDEQRRRDREDQRRRQDEKRHAREIARDAQPSITYVHEVRVIDSPKPERLRVLYLAANPEVDLRVDVEVRGVHDAVKKALHRDLIEIDHRPAATPDDLLDGINEMRPHVVHFSGHGGSASVLFDDAVISSDTEREAGYPVSFELLARALGATDTAPVLLVLNACESLEGASPLLDVTPVVIGMSSTVTDLGAAVFAARFYSAIASAQSVSVALEQGKVAVDAAGLAEGWMVNSITREDIDLSSVVLVQPPLTN